MKNNKPYITTTIIPFDIDGMCCGVVKPPLNYVIASNASKDEVAEWLR